MAQRLPEFRRQSSPFRGATSVHLTQSAFRTYTCKQAHYEGATLPSLEPFKDETESELKTQPVPLSKHSLPRL